MKKFLITLKKFLINTIEVFLILFFLISLITVILGFVYFFVENENLTNKITLFIYSSLSMIMFLAFLFIVIKDKCVNDNDIKKDI